MASCSQARGFQHTAANYTRMLTRARTCTDVLSVERLRALFWPDSPDRDRQGLPPTSCTRRPVRARRAPLAAEQEMKCC